MTPHNDDLAAARLGDQQAFGRLIEARWGRLVRLARSIVGDVEADDVAQESCVACWSHLSQLTDAAKFDNWLSRIVFRRAVRRARWQRAWVGRGFSLAVATALALGATGVCAQTPQAPPEPVYTIVTLLVGTTAPNTGTNGVMATLSSSNFPPAEAAQYAEDLLSLQEKIKATFHLDQLDVVQSFGDWMTPGREMVLEGGSVKLVVRADGVKEEGGRNAVVYPGDGSHYVAVTSRGRSAAYTLRLTSGPAVIFDRSWPVALGSRSILARQPTLNGPTYFIVIAAPIPGTPMSTTVGIEAQASTVKQDKGTGGGGLAGGVASIGVSTSVSGGGAAGSLGGGVSRSGASGGGQIAIVTSTGRELRPAKLLHSVQPTLTPEARAAGLKGPVILSGTIDASGSVQDIKVVRGVEGLNELAMAAFKQWRYAPPSPDDKGKPVRVQITVVLPFGDGPDQQ